MKSRIRQTRFQLAKLHFNRWASAPGRAAIGIGRVPVTDLDGADDIGAHAAHEMHLDPVMLLPRHAVLVVEPADKSARTEAR